MFRLGVLTVSDKGSRGEREDISGRVIQELLAPPDYAVERYEVVPDEQDLIASVLTRWADQDDLDLVVTTGGTGLAPRDVTPEATEQVIQRRVPGLSEAMRQESLKVTPMAMLSRATAGVRGRTLIINLPGSPKSVRECLEVVKPVLRHGLELLRGQYQEHPKDARV
ncbi:MAG: molybdopterin adenylyltransferase [Chloroflexota bacterium]|nr:molybdopterin adenylyltransferase [Chloroflexota bacterium]